MMYLSPRMRKLAEDGVVVEAVGRMMGAAMARRRTIDVLLLYHGEPQGPCCAWPRASRWQRLRAWLTRRAP
jgi:hypothetical protein